MGAIDETVFGQVGTERVRVEMSLDQEDARTLYEELGLSEHEAPDDVIEGCWRCQLAKQMRASLKPEDTEDGWF